MADGMASILSNSGDREDHLVCSEFSHTNFNSVPCNENNI